MHMRVSSHLASAGFAALLALAVTGPSWPGTDQAGRIEPADWSGETVYRPDCAPEQPQERPSWCNQVAHHEH
jgi:hypothetical protein